MESMKKHDLNVDKYLKRIGYKGSKEPNLENLTEIQRAHIRSVPYENLDILADKHLSLAIEAVYEKIVIRKRGGYCFELNGALAWLLKELKYDIVEFYGRWLKGEPVEIPPRRHRISRVKLDGKIYICDVGVGITAPQFPLLFEPGLEQTEGNESYRIVAHPQMVWVVQERLKGEWANLYSFSEEPQLPVDFFLPHYYCTTHPDSIFRNETMCYIRTEYGRNTIADVYNPQTAEKEKEFRVSLPDGTVGRYIPYTREQYLDALQKYFGIVLDE